MKEAGKLLGLGRSSDLLGQKLDIIAFTITLSLFLYTQHSLSQTINIKIIQEGQKAVWLKNQ